MSTEEDAPAPAAAAPEVEAEADETPAAEEEVKTNGTADHEAAAPASAAAAPAAAAPAAASAAEAARAIAAKLGSQMAGGGATSTPAAADEAATELGKRKARWSEDNSSGGDAAAIALAQAQAMAAAFGGAQASKKARVDVPDNLDPTLNIVGLLLGPRGANLKRMQERTGARLTMKGKGANKDANPSDPDANEPLHVVVEGSDEAVAIATLDLKNLLNSPEELAKLKQSQMDELNQLKNQNQNYGGGGNMMPYGGGMQQQGPYGGGGGGMGQYGSGGGGPDEMVFEIGNAVVGVVIGRGGENIQRIQRDYNVSIQIAKSNELPPGATMRPVTLKGSPQAMQAARAEIDNMLAERNSGPGGGGGYGGHMGGGGGHMGMGGGMGHMGAPPGMGGAPGPYGGGGGPSIYGGGGAPGAVAGTRLVCRGEHLSRTISPHGARHRRSTGNPPPHRRPVCAACHRD